MVSEKAEEILGIDSDSVSKDEIAVAFWLKTEEIDQQIIDTEDQDKLIHLLEEKDQLLEARAVLESVPLQQIRKELLEHRKGSAINPILLIAAVGGWIVATVLIFYALAK